jgi:hypothetical protein
VTQSRTRDEQISETPNGNSNRADPIEVDDRRSKGPNHNCVIRHVLVHGSCEREFEFAAGDIRNERCIAEWNYTARRSEAHLLSAPYYHVRGKRSHRHLLLLLRAQHGRVAIAAADRLSGLCQSKLPMVAWKGRERRWCAPNPVRLAISIRRPR